MANFTLQSVYPANESNIMVKFTLQTVYPAHESNIVASFTLQKVYHSTRVKHSGLLHPPEVLPQHTKKHSG
jgi:hypothetical protein